MFEVYTQWSCLGENHSVLNLRLDLSPLEMAGGQRDRYSVAGST